MTFIRSSVQLSPTEDVSPLRTTIMKTARTTRKTSNGPAGSSGDPTTAFKPPKRRKTNNDAANKLEAVVVKAAQPPPRPSLPCSLPYKMDGLSFKFDDIEEGSQSTELSLDVVVCEEADDVEGWPTVEEAPLGKGISMDPGGYLVWDRLKTIEQHKKQHARAYWHILKEEDINTRPLEVVRADLLSEDYRKTPRDFTLVADPGLTHKLHVFGRFYKHTPKELMAAWHSHIHSKHQSYKRHGEMFSTYARLVKEYDEAIYPWLSVHSKNQQCYFNLKDYQTAKANYVQSVNQDHKVGSQDLKDSQVDANLSSLYAGKVVLKGHKPKKRPTNPQGEGSTAGSGAGASNPGSTGAASGGTGTTSGLTGGGLTGGAGSSGGSGGGGNPWRSRLSELPSDATEEDDDDDEDKDSQASSYVFAKKLIRMKEDEEQAAHLRELYRKRRALLKEKARKEREEGSASKGGTSSQEGSVSEEDPLNTAMDEHAMQVRVTDEVQQSRVGGKPVIYPAAGETLPSPLKHQPGLSSSGYANAPPQAPPASTPAAATTPTTTSSQATSGTTAPPVSTTGTTTAALATPPPVSTTATAALATPPPVSTTTTAALAAAPPVSTTTTAAPTTPVSSSSRTTTTTTAPVMSSSTAGTAGTTWSGTTTATSTSTVMSHTFAVPSVSAIKKKGGKKAVKRKAEDVVVEEEEEGDFAMVDYLRHKFASSEEGIKILGFYLREVERTRKLLREDKKKTEQIFHEIKEIRISQERTDENVKELTIRDAERYNTATLRQTLGVPFASMGAMVHALKNKNMYLDLYHLLNRTINNQGGKFAPNFVQEVMTEDLAERVKMPNAKDWSDYDPSPTWCCGVAYWKLPQALLELFKDCFYELDKVQRSSKMDPKKDCPLDTWKEERGKLVRYFSNRRHKARETIIKNTWELFTSLKNCKDEASKLKRDYLDLIYMDSQCPQRPLENEEPPLESDQDEVRKYLATHYEKVRDMFEQEMKRLRANQQKWQSGELEHQVVKLLRQKKRMKSSPFGKTAAGMDFVEMAKRDLEDAAARKIRKRLRFPPRSGEKRSASEEISMVLDETLTVVDKHDMINVGESATGDSEDDDETPPEKKAKGKGVGKGASNTIKKKPTEEQEEEEDDPPPLGSEPSDDDLDDSDEDDSNPPEKSKPKCPPCLIE